MHNKKCQFVYMNKREDLQCVPMKQKQKTHFGFDIRHCKIWQHESISNIPTTNFLIIRQVKTGILMLLRNYSFLVLLYELRGGEYHPDYTTTLRSKLNLENSVCAKKIVFLHQKSFAPIIRVRSKRVAKIPQKHSNS